MKKTIKEDKVELNGEKKSSILYLAVYSLLIATLFFLVVIFPLIPQVTGGIGQNTTVITQLDVGNVYPEILSITFDGGNTSVDLIANSTKTVLCQAVLRDYNGDTDIQAVTARFFDNATSSYGGADDNNDHYTNNTCNISYGYGTSYEAQANCTFEVWYYANPIGWNCTVVVNDTKGLTVNGSNITTINELLAVGLPATIHYGTVNATNVSEENVTNVTNFGNVRINLTLSGYAVSKGDNLSMNCSLGALKNISIHYEKYNLTAPNPGVLSLQEFEGPTSTYLNLTSNDTVRKFDLNYRHNDGVNEAVNTTYWRIYVPLGVAGTCGGNIVFAAVKDDE